MRTENCHEGAEFQQKYPQTASLLEQKETK